MDQLNAQEQKELGQRLETKQMKEMISMYQRLVQKCFADCVTDFTTKSLHPREEGCVMRCFEKQSKGSERLSARFQEQQTEFMQSGAGGSMS